MKINFKDVIISKKEINALRPVDPVPPVDFVDQIHVSTKDNVQGKIDLNLTPYLRDPIKSFTDNGIESIFIIGPTQSGKTVIAQVCVAWTIDQDPGPMLYVYPDERTANKALDTKLVGMIKASPALRKHLAHHRYNTAGGSIDCDNMSIDIGWSGSIPTMNVMAKKRVIGDEIRLMKLQLGHESNAIQLMNDRLTTYLDYGIGQGLFISSPSVEGDLLHQQLDVPGTLILYWHVPCPHCGRFQLLDFFTNVKKPEMGELALCRCKYCDGIFNDADKKVDWNNKGVYAPKEAEIDEDGNIESKELDKKYNKIVYWWTSMVSPFRSFDRIWKKFIDTKDKVQDYRNFIQCWLAQFWKEKKSSISLDTLKARKTENFFKGEVPDWTQVLTGGIDTQDDCIYITVYAFSGNVKVALVDEERIMCPIENTSIEDLEGIIKTNVFNRIYYSSDGKPWRIGLTAWDSGGHRTSDVYTITKKFANVIAIKGRNIQNRTIIFSEKDTHYNIRTIEYMEETDKRCTTDSFLLPANVSQEFITQFSCMRKEERPNKKGKPILEWVSTGWDHFRYASCYTFCCLDIGIKEIGTLRTRLKDTSFKYNPAERLAIVPDQKSGTVKKITEMRDPFEKHERIKKDDSFW